MRTVLAVGTKCSIPRLPETLVRRPRLETLFANEARSQVTLVCGAPGAGKTTLLASWLASAPVGQVAWLTLDRRDNESRRFATLVTVALERAGALAGLGSLPYDGEDLLDAVFEHLVRRGQQCVLVLDDLQELASRTALRTLRHLVEQAPPVLDLVLASRADPPVPWGRLLMEGRLSQVRNADLRFSPEEAGELFTRHGIRLGRDDTHSLCERTEGWAAGLRLAACALSTDADPRGFVLSASATQVAVSDYLLTEVLDRQDEAAQQFLLRTSVVGRLTPDLAVSLTGDPRAGERLNALERRGIFLVELDEDGSYRYHALFGALLRARLRLSDRPLFTALHRKAALWHLANGLPREAEEHARSAGEWSLVGRLVLDRWLGKALDGKRPVDDLVAGMSAGAVGATPELSLVAAAQACWRSDRAEADLHRHVIAQVTLPGGTATAEWALARRVLDVEYARAFGDDAQARRAIRALADLAAAGDARAARAGRLAALRQAELDLVGGRDEAARRGLGRLVAVLASSRPEGGEAGGPSAASIVRPDRLPGEPVQSSGDEAAAWSAAAAGLLALDEALAGRLVAADGHGAAARALAAAARPRDGLPHAGGLAAALCCAQRGEPRGLSEALDMVDDAQLPNATWVAVRDVARWADRHQTRRPVALDGALAERPLVDRSLVALGLLETIDRHGRVRVHGGAGERVVVAARHALAAGHTGRDTACLDEWLAAVEAGLPGAGADPHPRTLVEAYVVAALLAGDGDTKLAAAQLDRALELFEATGIRAPFDQHADRLAPLLRRRAAERGSHQGMAVDMADRLPTGENLIVEPLTERELEVLTHLPTLMSNVEIAAGLHLSVNTVKSHLKAVYRKLGVDGRRHAVLRARELELL